jgi:death on curing protein
VLALHDEQLGEHGGREGLRDEGMLESALDRPKNLFQHGAPDIAALASSYAFALAKNHPFVDGNKRVSFVVTELFLDANGYDLVLDDAAAVATWRALAAGELGEDDLTGVLRDAIKQAK